MFFKPKVAIIYLVWSDEPNKYLVQALGGVARQTYSKNNLELVIVYNSHRPDEASAASFVREQVFLHQNLLPHATILEQEKNLGFAGGNNVGVGWALENGFDYIFLHNADGFLHASAIEKLVEAMEEDKNIGQAQPLILLHPDHHLINSAGNSLHYLGLGFGRFEQKPVDQYNFSKIEEVGYVSGAASMLRADLLKRHGTWKEIFFLYHEDTEYSLRLRVLGYKTVMAGEAIFYHKYEFGRSISKLYWIERNRHAIKLLFYKWKTLFLLFPLELLYNLGLLAAASRGKWVKELFKVYQYWLWPLNWVEWIVFRGEIQRTRIITDKQLLNQTVDRIDAGEGFVGGTMHRLANTIFTGYGRLIKIVVRW